MLIWFRLKNKIGNFDIVKEDNSSLSKLGAEFVTLDNKKAREYGIPGGVIVKKISEGAITDQTRMRDGFIIVKANDTEVKNLEDLKKVIGNSKQITITGFYSGYDGLYDYPIIIEE